MKSFLTWMNWGLVFLIPPTASAQSPREQVLKAMQERPSDPWPRGKGHVVLAIPGSKEEFKAYHEPGGSFSPAFGSFGVSIWITDANLKIKETSDSIPMSKIQQKLEWDAGIIPGIKTNTDFYQATWSMPQLHSWQLSMIPKISEPDRLFVVIRSVGPAASAIQDLAWTTNQLNINNRWSLNFAENPKVFQVVDPRKIKSTSQGIQEGFWKKEEDWGFAIFEVENQKNFQMTILDSTRSESPLLPSSTMSGVKLNVPEPEFAESLNAQVAHLLMGLVDRETRPGEPNNYPLNWLRDGAYVIVALARAGQVEVAKELCKPFAEHDFFGGFGSEADGPGLSLWALGEVCRLSNDPVFARTIWPHVERKVGIIEEMLSAKGPLRKPYVGPIVPAHSKRPDVDLVCDAAEDGLIIGKMDWHRPILYVNAVTYRGWIEAASMAQNLNKSQVATLWRDRADQLRAAWNKALESGDKKYDNERNFICSMYPTWVVSNASAFEQLLQVRQNSTHRDEMIKGQPLWTYFNVAQAHQWLVLGQQGKAWNDLQWFWKNQASPGLYTWWEGMGEENNFGRWKEIRGWVKPPHITPHYWTASEMLLLQLSMLAYVDFTEKTPVLVIGAGAPKEWFRSTLSAENVGTSLGKVDWEWKDEKLKVKMRGFKCSVKLGTNFPKGTLLEID